MYRLVFITIAYPLASAYHECTGTDTNCHTISGELTCDSGFISSCSVPLTADCGLACDLPNECTGYDTNCHTIYFNGVSQLTCDAGFISACSLPLEAHCDLYCATPQPTTYPTIDPTTDPTNIPTMSPTTAPTVAPTPDKPTPSPTDSDNVIFIDKDGCDCNAYCNNQTAACLTIDYAYDCFVGNNACASQGNDGNGNIKLGDGEWFWPNGLELIYDNEQVIITGNDMNDTTLYYNDTSFIGCTWYKCWLQIQNLTLSSKTSINNNNAMQIYMHQGGTLIFENVLFNGYNYNTNSNDPLWILKDERVSATFRYCIFENNDVMYLISDGASAYFINCVFRNNHQSSSAMFAITSASVTFDGCHFYNNSKTNGAFIETSNSSLNVINCDFEDNDVDILIDIIGDDFFSTFVCFNSSESKVIFDSNSFIKNRANSLIMITSSSMYSTHDIFDGNACNDYCIQSTDSVLSTDMQHINNLNFTIFDHLLPNSKSTICISNLSIAEISKYLTFNDRINSNNSKVIFSECADINVFSESYPNISTIQLSTFEQIFLNDVAGGAVLDTFICDDKSTSCAIVCNHSVSCFSSTLMVLNTNTATIHCGANFACGYTTINRTQLNNNKSTSFHIICEHETSCLHSTIYVDKVEIFVLDCVETDACSDTTVYITNTGTSSIICHHYDACDSLTIYTDSDNTTLTMYNYSSGITFSTPSGFTGDNIICDPNHAYIILDEQFISINDSISAFYPDLACADITFICNKTDSCDIIYNTDKSMIYDWKPFYDCFGPIALQDVLTLSCLGTCPASPTIAPTNAPTFAPSSTTKQPTSAPSVPPTISPTNAPSESPTFTPSQTPTITPSVAPTESPTVAPSRDPSRNPTLSPSYSPSDSPTFSPTDNPTLNPSISPSDAPSFSPTLNPSFSPSFAPSFSPTQHPISSIDFDSYIMITFVLGNLTNDDKLSILDDPFNETRHIEDVIENAYFLENFLSYQHFLVQILYIEGTEIDEMDTNTRIKWTNLDKLKLDTKIECNQNDENINYCESIMQQSQPENPFASKVQSAFQAYFENDQLSFKISEAKKLEIECKDCETEPFDYVLYALVSFVGFLCILSVAAFLYNKRFFPKLPGFNYVDDARWAALMLFALQFWDFYSDINLSVEILLRSDLFDDLMILISGFGSVFFILVPYIANLIIAANIKTIITKNAAAKGWFQYHTPIFTILVVLSGGVHAALSLVSSGIFGLKILNCGLTQYELKDLGRLKVFGTVILENIPQLICQALYTSVTGLNSTIAMAFMASFLSVIASSLSFWIEKDTADTKVVEYYVSTQCSLRSKNRFDVNNIEDLENIQERNIPTNISTSTTSKGGESVKHHALKQTDDDDEMEDRDTVIQSPTFCNVITAKERQNFIDNRGRTSALAESIAEVFRISPKNIEVGYSMITNYGVITHIVHYIYDDDLEIMQEELKENGIFNITVTAPYFAEQLFKELQRDISSVFRKHFVLNKDFEVTHHRRLGSGRRTFGRQKSKTIDDDAEGQREHILKRMATNIGVDHEGEQWSEMQVIEELMKLFKRDGIQNDDERSMFMKSLLQKIKAYEEDIYIGDNGNEIALEETNDGRSRTLTYSPVKGNKTKKRKFRRDKSNSLQLKVLHSGTFKQKSISVQNESDDEFANIEMEEMNNWTSTPI